MAPVFSGDDDWLSEIELPAPAAEAETDETLSLGRNSAFSRLGPRRIRLLQVAVGIMAAALVALFLVHAATRHTPPLAPPAPVVGLSFQVAMSPTMSSECARDACIRTPATSEDLASLRGFFGPTYLVRGHRLHDRHDVLRGVAVTMEDSHGDYAQVHAIRSPSVPAHWAGMHGIDRTVLVIRTVVRSPSQGLWLVETRTLNPDCRKTEGADAVPLWDLTETGATAAELHL
jgi:hypothetical protein